MTTVGIPKGLFYFEYGTLWERFFKNLGCQVDVSINTNKEIMDEGVKLCSNEDCLPVKLYLGHASSLADHVDFLFVPRFISTNKNEYTCPKFCALPDLVKISLRDKVKVIELRLHEDLYPWQTYESLIDLSRELDMDYVQVAKAYEDALEFWEDRTSHQKGSRELGKRYIGVLGHPYMLNDKYLSMHLLDKLRSKGVEVYAPKDIPYKVKRENAHPFCKSVFWGVGVELLGSANTFLDDKNLKGLIYITPFGCGVDAFVMEFIERRAQASGNTPFLKLTVDEHTGEAGFDTRIEAFLDMVGD